MDFRIRRDRFYKTRGGTATLLRIQCSRCASEVCVYQKDGNGQLLRLYWDRVLVSRCSAAHEPGATRDDMTPLACNTCGLLIGIPMVYIREDRLAWRLSPGSIRRTRLRR